MIVTISACNPTIYLPKQNLSGIDGEEPNTEEDDIAPAMEKISECLKRQNLYVDTAKVMPSSKYIKSLFNYEEMNADKTLRRVLDNMTKNVESLFFTDTKSGFASFAHPPAAEFLMGQNLPFDKNDNAGGTDIFYFAPDKNNIIRFRNFYKINSPYWDSHPTAVNGNDSKGNCVTLLIFSSDRNYPFSKAVNLQGDTIYGGSTDLFYTFGSYSGESPESEDLRFLNLEWTEPQLLTNANSDGFNDGSPFVFCSKYNPTLLYSSNRNNQNWFDYDIYAAKLLIDYDNKILRVISKPELIDSKSPVTDSLTYSINTPADERFPFIPFPHQEMPADNPLYFSSNRNSKPVNEPCDCDKGFDRTENIGGYDIYRYLLPDKYKCPIPKDTLQPVYEPQLIADITVVNLENPEEPVRMPFVSVLDESGNIIQEDYEKGNIRIKLNFEKNYIVRGGSKFNEMDCISDNDIIFRGYKAPEEKIYEKNRDSLITTDVLTGFTMNLNEFVKFPREVSEDKKGIIVEKGIPLNSDDIITEKIINASITGDLVNYDKRITTVKYWNRIDLRPTSFSENNAVEIGLNGQIRSVRTMNDEYYYSKPESNETIIIYDTVYLLPDYIVKPPCYCEFSGVLTNYQQNVPYFQTGYWDVNTLKNYRRDLRKLETFSYNDASWIELHKNNQYFGEGMKGRLKRTYEYESFAKVVDSNLYKMADMISNKIIPAFKVIDSISPGSKLIISLDAWSDRRPVKKGWYIGENIAYVEGSLHENIRDYDVEFHKLFIEDKSSLSFNNDTLSRLRAYYGYKALLEKLLDTTSVGKGFYDYYQSGLTLLPDDEKLYQINLNKPFSLKSVEELIFKSKIIILAKGNYFDSTEYKIPRYIRDVDSSLFMLDTIRRIDVRINSLQYQAGKLIKSPCCNENLPCLEYRDKINGLPKKINFMINDDKKKKR
ncbi:MAG: hypothetical protein WCZ17_01570 [Candidatus Kapaibacterium sp.]